MLSILIKKLDIYFFLFWRKQSFTLPNDWTPFDNAKKQISQVIANATHKWITMPSTFSIPLLSCNACRLNLKKYAYIYLFVERKK